MILKRQSLQVNLILLGFLVFLLLSLSYGLSYRKAWDAYSRNKAISAELEQRENIESQINSIQSKFKLLGDQYAHNLDTAASFESAFLNFIGRQDAKKNIRIVGFSEPYRQTIKDYLIETIVVEMEGGYEDQLRLLKAIETDYYGIDVISVKLEKRMNLRLKRNELFQKIYVQRVSKI